MARNHHYGPGPWVTGGHADWTRVYYHRADTLGVGFDRTAAGSDAVSQYQPPVRDRFARRETFGDSLLLWFHRVGWDERMASGRTLWEELVHRYSAGVDSVRAMRRTWDAMAGRIDAERHAAVARKLATQERVARWWRDASLLYFQQFARTPIPPQYERPARPLEFYTAHTSDQIPDF